MPIASVLSEMKGMTCLPENVKSKNVIIHSAHAVDNLSSAIMQNMASIITLLGPNGDPLPGASSIFITGTVMNAIVTHEKKKVRYVFDETISKQQGWKDRVEHNELYILSQKATLNE